MAEGEDCPQRWASMIVAGSFVLGHRESTGKLLNQYNGKGHGYHRATLHFPPLPVEAACIPRLPSTRGSMQVSLGESHMMQGPSHFN